MAAKVSAIVAKHLAMHTPYRFLHSQYPRSDHYPPIKLYQTKADGQRITITDQATTAVDIPVEEPQ